MCKVDYVYSFADLFCAVGQLGIRCQFSFLIVDGVQRGDRGGGVINLKVSQIYQLVGFS